MVKPQDDISEKIKGAYKSLLRVNTLGWIFSVCVLLLFLRVSYLQTVKGNYYKKQSDENCTTVEKIPAARGEIYDRNYVPLVANRPAYTFGIIPRYFAQNQDRKKALDSLSVILDMPAEDIEEKISRGGSSANFLLSQIPVKRNISEKEFALLEEKKIEISGLTVTQEPIRRYDYKNVASHILGYVGEIGDDELKSMKYKDTKSAGDIIGQTGVENVYDDILRGEDGQKLILTDASGKQKEIIKTIPPKQGKNIVLTIDYRIQKYAEKLLEKYNFKGCIIVQDPRTGEILCMASKPDYDLEYFSGGVNPREWKNLIRNKAYPLTNRAVQGLYSPGSIFKVAVGSGALNENVITTKDSFLCEGIYWIKTWPYKCWKRAGHGWMDFYHAVAESCDIYFYKVGLKMKVELLNKYGTMFGLGEKTGIDLPGEKAGLMPSREWKLREDRSPWFPGNTVMMSIGQGYITATPLQIMNIMTVMANSGFVMVPHVLKAVTLDNRRIESTFTPKKLFELSVKPDVIHTMNSALKLDVMTQYGTGHKAHIEGLSAAGKTATVQNPHGDNHAMFVGYAPFENPEIVVYVLIEFGGGGGEAAAPLAGDIFEFYFRTLRDK